MKHQILRRAVSAFLAGLLCFACLCGPAYALEADSGAFLPSAEQQAENVPESSPVLPAESMADGAGSEEAAAEPTEETDASMPEDMETPAQADGNGGDTFGQEEPSLDEISRVLYGDLPDAPTGSYMGSCGLPVAIGETKIGIGLWKDDLPAGDSTGHLDAEALNTENASVTVACAENESYAIVPVMVQVEYPANGSTSQVILPENVTLLSFEDTGRPANGQEAAAVLSGSYVESSAAASGFYVRASEDFTARFVYTAPDGSSLTKQLNVHVDGDAPASQAADISTYAERPVPGVTTGKITAVQKVNGTWLIWFNGQPAYCCTHGAQGQPAGCPTYTYSHTSIVTADQYTPGDHYANQINIWGGLGQLSLGLTAAYASDPFASYDDTQWWIMEHYPDSVAGQGYLRAAEQAENGVTPYAADSDYYVYIYTPPEGYPWQTVAVPGPPTGGIDPDIPPAGAEYYASWQALPQTVGGSFDCQYTVRVDKEQLETGEQVDGAVIELEPLEKSGVIDGGSWAISPAETQTVTTGGHSMDSHFQHTGGSANASWSLHYEVSKTSVASLSGREGPYASQTEADAAADSARSNAESQLRAEAQSMVDSAIAAAKKQLAELDFRYDEITVPVGFEFYNGSEGSRQAISVPADRVQDHRMRNDEWSVQANIQKTDSETGRPIAADARFEVFQWDVVADAYMPHVPNIPHSTEYGRLDYNKYRVERNAEGTYSVVNDAAYGTEFDTSRTMYYTQRNEGKFLLVETSAPQGYFGDWTDAEHPGKADTPLGKRAYFIEITKVSDSSVIWLDNADYNADIAMSYTGGVKLVTSDGDEATVTLYDAPQAAGRSYVTDAGGKAANEDSYAMHPQDGVFQNDRVLGEISLSKVDLDAVRYVDGRDTDGDAMAGGQAHADARLDGAVYDLYAANDIHHPDGVSGVVDYSKIVDADGRPIWHTTIRDNSGQWVEDYLPVLAKDHLVASARIEDGWLTFSNLYLGEYYIVERGTGVTIPVKDGAFVLSGEKPDIDSKTKEPVGTASALAVNAAGQYTDYVYQNRWSYIGQSKAPDGTKTYDGYYESYAKGYLCDERNYYITPAYENEGWYIEKTTFADDRQAEGERRDTTEYGPNYHIHRDNELAESDDQVMKGNVEVSKHISGTGSSEGVDLEGAGFTFYLISDLSKEAEFTTSRGGQYMLDSILKAYINAEYDGNNPKYDLSAETQAIAKTYEVDAAQIEAYNESLTDAGDCRNGSGEGWVATGRPNEYRLSEIFSNDTGNIRVQGLPYGQYLVVETTIPKNVWQAEPFIVNIDPGDVNNPQSGMANPKGAVQTPSGSYQKYTVLDEEIEVYLRITKIDEETGKPAALPDTAFQIYYMDENGNHILDEHGNPRRVVMTDTANGQLTKDVDTFYTTEQGVLTLPEKLPVGAYRIVEAAGPNGFYNEWLATAVYDGEHLQIDDTGRYADGAFYVDFEVSSDRAYRATGDDSEDGQDILVIDEAYRNRETLGKLTIRKMGEVLVRWSEDERDTLDPEFSGEARPGHFVYEERPIAGVQFTVTAAENIYTQDRQTDAYGNRTLWYAKGDVVAVVTTGDGTANQAAFSPGRTPATYDFLSVIHDGTVGEVSLTLPLGKYHIEETKPPYGFTGTGQSYDVEFTWRDQYEAVIDEQTITFRNRREKAEAVVVKQDSKTERPVAGAVFNLYTDDAIYSAEGKLLFCAGDLVFTSAPTDAQGRTVFPDSLPIRGEYYGTDGVYIPENSYGTGRDARCNSGNYTIRELRPPEGYFVNDEPMSISFTYDGAEKQVLQSICKNDATSVLISKRAIGGSEELPGATLSIQNEAGETVRQWISGKEAVEIRGLHLNEIYTLTETQAPDGYLVAEAIRFKLVQRKDADENLLNENDVYICTGKDWLLFDHWELCEDGMIVMFDETKTDEPQPPLSPPPALPKTGDLLWLPLALGVTAALAGVSLALLRVSRRKQKGNENE